MSITDTANGTGSETIDSLLGADLATQTADPAAEDTSVNGAETVVEDDPQAAQDDEGATDTGTATGDDDSQGDGSGEGDDTEGELNLDELETDFADSAYQRAAAHWAKRGMQLDPSDPGQRAMLKDWMERGQKIAELSRQPEAAAAEPEDKTEPVVTKTPQEQFQQRLTETSAFVKESFKPEMAKQVVQPIVDALAEAFWPGKNVKIDLQGEALAKVSGALSTAMIIQLSDAIPSILQAVPKTVEGAYPMFGRMVSMAERESAVEELTGAEKDGRPLCPGIDKLIDNGTIKRIMNTELKDAVFVAKDPYKNMVAKAKVAYQMARGQTPNPELLRKAVVRGKEMANDRQRRVAAGKLSPGSSGRGFSDTSKQSFKDQLLSNSGPGMGGRFSRLIKTAKG